MPSSSWKTQRKVGDGVGWLMWFGTVSWFSAKCLRSRRCATEQTSNARVITMSNPSIRLGFLTNNDETKNRVVSLSCCDGLLSILETGVRWYVVGQGTLRAPDTRVTPPSSRHDRSDPLPSLDR